MIFAAFFAISDVRHNCVHNGPFVPSDQTASAGIDSLGPKSARQDQLTRDLFVTDRYPGRAFPSRNGLDNSN